MVLQISAQSFERKCLPLAYSVIFNGQPCMMYTLSYRLPVYIMFAHNIIQTGRVYRLNTHLELLASKQRLIERHAELLTLILTIIF